MTHSCISSFQFQSNVGWTFHLMSARSRPGQAKGQRVAIRAYCTWKDVYYPRTWEHVEFSFTRTKGYKLEFQVGPDCIVGYCSYSCMGAPRCTVGVQLCGIMTIKSVKNTRCCIGLVSSYRWDDASACQESTVGSIAWPFYILLQDRVLNRWISHLEKVFLF